MASSQSSSYQPGIGNIRASEHNVAEQGNGIQRDESLNAAYDDLARPVLEHAQVELARPDLRGAQHCLEEHARNEREDQAHGKDVLVEQDKLDVTS